MKIIATVALAAALLAPAGCKKDSASKDRDSAETARILGLIPDDTPLALVSTDPIPRSVTEAFGEALAPMASKLEAELREDLSRELDPGERGVLELLDGKLDRAGLESLGFTLEPRFAVYAIGFSLAVRIELADGKKVATFFDDLARSTTDPPPRVDFNGTSYWPFGEGELLGVIAIVRNEVVIGLMHRNARDKVLPVLFGQKKPDKSLADSGGVQKLRAKYGLMGVGMGYFDSLALVRMITGQASALSRDIIAASDVDLPPFSDTCREELAELAGVAPRFVYGYRELDGKRSRSVMALELRPDIAKDLAAVRPSAIDLPALTTGSPALTLGLDLDLAALVAWLERKAGQLQADPYRCEHLASIDEGMAETSREAVRGLSMLGGFKGAALVVQEVKKDGPIPTGTGYGVAVLDNIEGAVQMLAAELASEGLISSERLAVEPDGKPVTVPLGLPGVPNLQLVARPGWAGVAVGPGMTDRVGGLMTRQASPDGPLLTMSWDYQAFGSLLDDDPADPAADEAFAAWTRLYGANKAEVRVTADSIRIEQTTESH